MYATASVAGIVSDWPYQLNNVDFLGSQYLRVVGLMWGGFFSCSRGSRVVEEEVMKLIPVNADHSP